MVRMQAVPRAGVRAERYKRVSKEERCQMCGGWEGAVFPWEWIMAEEAESRGALACVGLPSALGRTGQAWMGEGWPLGLPSLFRISTQRWTLRCVCFFFKVMLIVCIIMIDA